MTGKTVITPNKVLAYHKIDRKREIGITVVNPDKFRRQVNSLVRRGYNLVTLTELFFSTDEKDIAITFDDGYQNLHQYALPVLEEFEARATVFIICSAIGKHNTWDANLGGIKFRHLDKTEIRELIGKGWEVGSHGFAHTALHDKNQDLLAHEIGDSRQYLQQEFDVEINFFSAPFGRVNRKVLDACKKYGYKGCCGFYPMHLFKQAKPDMMIPRIGVYAGETEASVARKISGNYRLLKRAARKQNFINFWNNGTIIWQRIKDFLALD